MQQVRCAVTAHKTAGNYFPLREVGHVVTVIASFPFDRHCSHSYYELVEGRKGREIKHATIRVRHTVRRTEAREPFMREHHINLQREPAADAILLPCSVRKSLNTDVTRQRWAAARSDNTLPVGI